jgi:hypothetical protein
MSRLVLLPLVAGALFALSLTPADPPSAAATPVRVRTHCRPPELTVYQCDYGASVLSVCEDHGQVSYRYGRPGAPQIAISSNGHDGAAHYAETTGVGGADQIQMRFTRGIYNYIVFAGDSLPYREGGPIRNGVAVTRSGRTLSTRLCPDTSRGQVIDPPQNVALDGADQEMLPWR